MRPVRFPGVNATIGKPKDMSDEQCLSLPVQKGIDSDGFPYYLTAWLPNKEDVEAINSGKPIYLKVVGQVTPPVAVFTTDENGEIND